MTAAKRGRGRPRAADSADRRAAILDAARAQFASAGVAGTSLRSIAREAQCDVSLISHYFGGKAQLLIATMELPVNPIDKITTALSGEPAGRAERLLSAFLESWDPHHETLSTMVHAALTSSDAEAPMLQVAREVLIASLVTSMSGESRELRASLIASQLIGLASMRYIARLEPLASASVGDVVQLYAPGLQALIEP